MTFDVQFFNQPTLTLLSTSKRLFQYDLLDFSINGVRSQLRNGTSDLGTIPDLAEDIVQNDDPHWIRAFILHDALCDAKGDLPDFLHFSGFQAAQILKAAGLFDGASEDKANIIFIAVCLGGPHWK